MGLKTVCNVHIYILAHTHTNSLYSFWNLHNRLLMFSHCFHSDPMKSRLRSGIFTLSLQFDMKVMLTCCDVLLLFSGILYDLSPPFCLSLVPPLLFAPPSLSPQGGGETRKNCTACSSPDQSRQQRQQELLPAGELPQAGPRGASGRCHPIGPQAGRDVRSGQLGEAHGGPGGRAVSRLRPRPLPQEQPASPRPGSPSPDRKSVG